MLWWCQPLICETFGWIFNVVGSCPATAHTKAAFCSDRRTTSMSCPHPHPLAPSQCPLVYSKGNAIESYRCESQTKRIKIPPQPTEEVAENQFSVHRKRPSEGDRNLVDFPLFLFYIPCHLYFFNDVKICSTCSRSYATPWDALGQAKSWVPCLLISVTHTYRQTNTHCDFVLCWQSSWKC